MMAVVNAGYVAGAREREPVQMLLLKLYMAPVGRQGPCIDVYVHINRLAL